MRFAIGGLLLLTSLPAIGANTGPRGQCKSRCDSSYNFCLNRSILKNARKACKTERKACKKTCVGK